MLSAGLLEICDQPVFTPAVIAGLRDTLDQVPGNPLEEGDERALAALLADPPRTLPGAATHLEEVLKAIPGGAGAAPEPEAAEWLERFRQECREHAEELRGFLPESDSFP